MSVFRYPIALDVGWYLYIAEAVGRGATMHRDFWEINPPLVVYLTRVPTAMGSWIGVDPIYAFRVATLLVAGASAALCYRTDRDGATAPHARLVGASALFAFVALPGGEFGQRDHLFAVLSMPYVFCAASRATPRGWRLIAGVAAGFGVALKPHFLILPALVEALVAVRDRRLRLRPESGAILAVLASYGVVLMTVDREWFRVARLAARYYPAFSPIDRPGVLTVGGIVILTAGTYVLASARYGSRWDSRVFLLATAAAGLVTLVAQGKGFPYHWLPLGIAAVLVLGVSTASVVTGFSSDSQRASLPIAPPLMAMTVLVGCTFQTTQAWRGGPAAWRAINGPPITLEAVRTVVRQRADGGSIYSFWGWPGFPTVNYENVAWGSTFQSNWLLPAVVAARRRGAPDDRLEELLFDVVRRDLAEKRPTLLVIDEAPRHAKLDRIDFLGLVSADSAVSRELEAYCELMRTGRYVILERRNESSGGGCP